MVKSEDLVITTPSSKSIPTTSPCRKRKYKGVRMRSWGSWVSEIRAPNQKTRIWLGSYSTAEAAARAYDAALLCLKGSSANLNFPTTSTPPHIPDTIMSPKSIQRVAAAAAAAAETTSTTPTTTPTTTTTTTSSTTPSTPSPLPSTSSSDSSLSILPYWPSYSNDQEWMHSSPVDPWIDFDDHTPDQMLNACSMLAPLTTDDFYEEGGIHLWSFC